MADFASFQNKASDFPLVINLDRVDLIVSENNTEEDVFYIIFTKIQEKQRDENGRILPWHKQPSGTLMTWQFSTEDTGQSAEVTRDTRDDILQKLVSGERQFKLYSYKFF